ncbi:hypothetical protein C8R44DRAFT_752759 [Mycena epipterygia]|nr:hypothetical protein C8R44DRAFT_752759 [Mycena epipterygia]
MSGPTQTWKQSSASAHASSTCCSSATSRNRRSSGFSSQQICSRRVFFLMIDLMHPELNFTHQFFRNVSHLALDKFNTNHSGDFVHAHWRHWPTIFRLPAFIHLALGHRVSPGLVQAILTSAPRLEILLISSGDEGTAALFSEELVLHDVRLVLGGLGHIKDFKVHPLTHSLNELLTQAEQFVARKRSGQIPVLITNFSVCLLLDTVSIPPTSQCPSLIRFWQFLIQEVLGESGSGRHEDDIKLGWDGERECRAGSR